MRAACNQRFQTRAVLQARQELKGLLDDKRGTALPSTNNGRNDERDGERDDGGSATGR